MIADHDSYAHAGRHQDKKASETQLNQGGTMLHVLRAILFLFAVLVIGLAATYGALGLYASYAVGQ